MFLKNILSMVFMIALFGIPIGVGMLWWRSVPDRWWAHLLFAPGLLFSGFVLFLIAYYGSFNAEGQMSGGFAIAILPLCAGLILTVVGYYLLLAIRLVRRVRKP